MKNIGYLFFLIFSSFVFSQQLDSKKLDEYFNTLDQNKKVMGSFAISQNGKVVYTKSIGFADVAKNQKANPETEYRIGSISKIFTSVLVMKAVESGKLTLDQKLSAFYPQIKNAEKITIQNLLQHRSGIHNFTSDEAYLSYHVNPLSEAQLIEKIGQGGSDFEPDSKYEYSNSNYSLLAFILEKIEKKKYANLIEEKIVKPLQLKHTTVGGNINASNNQAFSYTFKDGKYDLSDETDMSVPIGAGNIISTASDLLVFINALENGTLVSKESLEIMKTFKDNYGLGLFPVPFNTHQGFGHNGGIDYFQSTLYYFPDGKTAISALINQSNYDNNQISIILLSAAYGMDFKIPSFAVVEVDETQLKPFVGTYSNPKFPLKINIFIEAGTLMAQATGQGSFPLEATSKTEFKFDTAGITLTFNAEKGEMFYTQMGQALTFKKEN